MEYEKLDNYVKTELFSETVKKIKLTDRQRKLVNDLILEINQLNVILEQKIKTTIDKKIFLLPLLMLEGESSSLIEGTRTKFEDFAYDVEEINNIPQWETRNLINLYEKYFTNDYYLESNIFSVESISQLHIELYKDTSKSKFQMTYDTSAQIKRIRPGWILNDDNKPNFISVNNMENASLIMLKPSLKRIHLEDLVQTINDKINSKSLLIDHILLIHPIFEAIHPYVDGNGRIGRFLITIAMKLLHPNFLFPIYLSESFVINNQKYKEKLWNVQKNNDYESWNKWISYFIDCLIFTKRKISYRINAIIELYNDISKTKAFTTSIRKNIVYSFFKYYKINKKLTIKRIKEKNKNVTEQTIYKDWNIVEKILEIQDNGDGYFTFETLFKILRKE